LPHLYWHQHWNHDGYILAISKFDSPNDDGGPQIIVSQRGGIFWWYTRSGPGGSHFLPDHFESKLRSAEFDALKKDLASMSPSNGKNKTNHYIISFENHGRWITRLYNTLPPGSPFELLIQRMIYQSHNFGAFAAPDEGFLNTLPEQRKQRTEIPSRNQ
jgi:hypothetical protein